MQAFGALLVIWGFADFFLSLADIDIYMELFDYYVPDALWSWTPWIAVLIGTLIYRAEQTGHLRHVRSVIKIPLMR